MESAQHKSEQPSLDAASKLFKYNHHLAISCDTLSDLLHQHETDFMQLVEIKTLPLKWAIDTARYATLVVSY